MRACARVWLLFSLKHAFVPIDKDGDFRLFKSFPPAQRPLLLYAAYQGKIILPLMH